MASPEAALAGGGRGMAWPEVVLAGGVRGTARSEPERRSHG